MNFICSQQKFTAVYAAECLHKMTNADRGRHPVRLVIDDATSGWTHVEVIAVITLVSIVTVILIV